MTAKRAFWISVGFSIFFRAVIAALLPMTGDEAYYVFWGKHPALGYYDQPPMVGWWLAALLQVSDAQLWVRLPAILTPAFVAWVLTRLGGYWAGALFALAPIGILLPLITTDVPLLFFCALTVLLWKRERWGWAGVAAGAAFLSKYFAVLLLPALAGHLFYTRRKRAWRPLVLALVAACWAPVLHLYWNSQNCWSNFVFNLFVRNSEERFLLHHVTDYVLQQLYLLTPPLLYWVLRDLRKPHSPLQKQEALWLWALPTLVFFLLTFRFGIGMHFVLAFYPYFFVLVAGALSEKKLRAIWRGGWGFLALHGVVIAVLFQTVSLDALRERPFYRGLLQTLAFPQITQQMEAAERELSSSTPVQWLADGYTQAALLGFHGHRSAWVLGGGSDFGRQTDFVADWEGLRDRSAVLFYQYASEPTYLRQYFARVKTQHFTRGDLSYWIVQLSGFDPAAYRRVELNGAFEKYYLLSRNPGHCALYQSTRR